jgi:hypothetical protein
VRTLALAGLPAALGFAAVVGLRVNRRGVFAVMLLTVASVMGVYLWAYLSASRLPDPSSCDGCQRHLGRYWDPGYDVALALLTAGCVVVGAGIGALVLSVCRPWLVSRRADARNTEA